MTNLDDPIEEERIRSLMAGEVGHLIVRAPEAVAGDFSEFDSSVIVPGAFNPVHEAHLEMACLAGLRLNRPVWFELSLANVDKHLIEFPTLLERRNQDFGEFGLVLSASPRFVQKAELFPGCVFAVGKDTIHRINHARYYEGCEQKLNDAIGKIRDLGCRFLVFHRNNVDKGSDESNNEGGRPLLIPELDSICEYIPVTEFSMEISSTEIRRRLQPGESDEY